MNKSLAAFYLLIALLSLPLMAVAQTYQWRDENGQLHFSDQPPSDQEAIDISDQLKSINIDSSNATTQSEIERLDRRQAAVAREEADNIESNISDEQLQQQCRQAKQQLRILQGRVTFSDAEGNEIKVSEQERQQMASELEAQIRLNCP